MRLVSGGLWLYSTWLLLTAPATLIDAGLQQWSEGRMRLVNAEGTLWSGGGQLELRNAEAQSLSSTGLRWQSAARNLMTAQLGWHIDLAGQAQAAQLLASLRWIELNDFNLTLPAAAAAAMAPALAGYGVGGLLHIQAPRLRFGTDASVSTNVKWLDASTLLAPVAPLGSYELQVDGTGEGLALELQTLAGPLHLQGQGTALSGAGLQYAIFATLPEAGLEQLVPFLQLVAVGQPDGRFLLQRE